MKIRQFSQLFIIALAALLVSCSSKAPKPVAKTPTASKTVEIEKTAQTAQDYLQQVNPQNKQQTLDSLILAISAYIEEQQYNKAVFLATQASALTTNNRTLFDLHLAQAQALALIGRGDEASISLENAEEALPIEQLERDKRGVYFQTLANVEQQLQRPINYLNALLRYQALTAPSEEDINQTWLALNDLAQWQIEQLTLLNPPNMQGWQQLLNFAHRFGFQPSTFQRYLRQWQRNFAGHLANSLIPELMSTELSSYDQERNIAILLPLSGQRKNAGEAAQQGILAAFNDNEETNLHFIDTNQLNFATLDEQLINKNVDTVIGPLLKDNVDAYISSVTTNTPTVLLNLPLEQPLQAHHFAFSMNPAEEAIQAATTLSRMNYQSPIVFVQEDSVSQRIAQQFISQWNKHADSTPEVIEFTDASKVQEKLESSLELDLSKERIKDIDNRIRQSLKTQARNRRDIDMIYIVASPNETRLLKPYIDVNISPFAQSISVFASSRSHSNNADASDSRDLEGLSFTEMPWLLSSKQQNAQLKQINNLIWPQRSDSLERIFAMGYDSFSLVNKFKMFSQHTYIRHYGQTGIIKLNSDQTLTRSLLWGKYEKDRVSEIAME